MHRDLYRLGGHSKSFGQTKTSSSGEEERINIKPRIITVLRSVLVQINEIVAWEHIHFGNENWVQLGSAQFVSTHLVSAALQVQYMVLPTFAVSHHLVVGMRNDFFKSGSHFQVHSGSVSCFGSGMIF